jgi:hypothetical protein
MKSLTTLTNEEIKLLIKDIVWNKRELEFIKPSESYFEFCKSKRYIVNTVNSYSAFDQECAMWRNIAMGMILADRIEFNAN